jgi:hypothetical protein
MSMIRIKIVRDHKDFHKGEVKFVSSNEAFGLIERGIAMVSKDMTSGDMELQKEKLRAKSRKEGAK